MNLIERRFTNYQNQLAPFLQNHVGGAMNQIVSETVRYGCQRAHATRRDHHAQRYKGSAGDSRTLIAKLMVVSGQALNFLNCVFCFMRQGACRPFAHHQMRFDSGAMQHLEQTDTEDGSSSTCDTDYQPRWFCLMHKASLFREVSVLLSTCRTPVFSRTVASDAMRWRRSAPSRGSWAVQLSTHSWHSPMRSVPPRGRDCVKTPKASRKEVLSGDIKMKNKKAERISHS